MDFATEIRKNSLFQELVKEIEQLETERVYCKHGMAHLMDVCRLAWIFCLEDLCETGYAADFSSVRDRIFVAGLLHDIGRGVQYKTGEHHAGAGARLAEEILTQVGYPEAWKEETVEIIRLHCGRHRHLPDGVARENLRKLFDGSECENDVRKMVIADYISRADQLSRPCFCCSAADTCKWTDAERNQVLR